MVVAPRNNVDAEFDSKIEAIGEDLSICGKVQEMFNKLEQYSGLYRTLKPPVFCWGDPARMRKIWFE